MHIIYIYTPRDSDLLEVMSLMYETKHMQTLEIGHWTYSFDFSGMMQTNVSTGTSRLIRRYVSRNSSNVLTNQFQDRNLRVLVYR